VVRKHPPLSRISSEGEGGAVVRKHPPLSRISSEGGGDAVVGKRKHPLHLAFRAREGVVVVVVWLKNTCLGYQVRGAGGVVRKQPPSHVSSEESKT
jgi:hypothetical protein